MWPGLMGGRAAADSCVKWPSSWRPVTAGADNAATPTGPSRSGVAAARADGPVCPTGAGTGARDRIGPVLSTPTG